MKVLLAIDGSSHADLALDLVANVRWPDETVIRVAEAVRAHPFGVPWPVPVTVEADMMEGDLRADAERTLDDARARLERLGLSVESVVLHGRAATAIVDEAKAMAADLIVVGSRGHGTIESMLLGSVSAEVIDHAPVPVLVARGHRIGHVILAWDGSSCATRAADLLRMWPIFRGASVRVVAVADVDVPWWTGFPEPGSAELMPMYIEAAEASRKRCGELAQTMVMGLRRAGLQAEVDRREGDPAAELLSAARSPHADLIVLGTHGRTRLARLVLGSVARNVIRHASCSILVVREREAAAASGAA